MWCDVFSLSLSFGEGDRLEGHSASGGLVTVKTASLLAAFLLVAVRSHYMTRNIYPVPLPPSINPSEPRSQSTKFL